jgi:hypothetical protein
MANIEDWYGRNSIGWGESYDSSWFGNTNEPNSWGIIYPFNADGSLILADTNLISADTTQYKADATQF